MSFAFIAAICNMLKTGDGLADATTHKPDAAACEMPLERTGLAAERIRVLRPTPMVTPGPRGPQIASNAKFFASC